MPPRKQFRADYTPMWAREKLAQHPDVAAYLHDCVNYADQETGEVSRSVDAQAAAMGVDRRTVYRRRAKAIALGLLARLTTPRPPKPGEQGRATRLQLMWAPGWWRRKADIARARLIRAAMDAKMLRSRTSSGVTPEAPVVVPQLPSEAGRSAPALGNTFLLGSGDVPYVTRRPKKHRYIAEGVDSCAVCGLLEANQRHIRTRVAVPA